MDGLQWKIPSRNGWFEGTPISRNHQLISVINRTLRLVKSQLRPWWHLLAPLLTSAERTWQPYDMGMCPSLEALATPKSSENWAQHATLATSVNEARKLLMSPHKSMQHHANAYVLQTRYVGKRSENNDEGISDKTNLDCTEKLPWKISRFEPPWYGSSPFSMRQSFWWKSHGSLKWWESSQHQN